VEPDALPVVKCGQLVTYKQNSFHWLDAGLSLEHCLYHRTLLLSLKLDGHELIVAAAATSKIRTGR
jgi:hypothetical protein